MSSLKYFIGALAVTASIAAPAVAHASTETENCLDGTKAASYTTSFTRGTGTIATVDGLPLCEDTNIVLESWNVPDSWDRVEFDATAIPQTKFAVVTVTLPAGQANLSKTVSIDVPADCKNTQLDYYFTPEYDKIDDQTPDDDRFIGGVLFAGVGDCATPTPTATPAPTPVSNPQVLGDSTSPTVLPDTGASDLGGALGLTAAIGAAGFYIKQRLGRK